MDVSIVIRGEVWLQEPVREALEGAKCVLGALQFGNDPGFSKHDWDADEYNSTESLSCTSRSLNPPLQVSSTPTSKLILFPPSLPSSPPDVSSPTSSELMDLVDSVLFPLSFFSNTPSPY